MKLTHVTGPTQTKWALSHENTSEINPSVREHGRRSSRRTRAHPTAGGSRPDASSAIASLAPRAPTAIICSTETSVSLQT